jgi:putative membrane protein
VITMMWWFGGGMMVLFWAAVIFGIVALIRYAGRDGQRSGGPQGGQSPEPAAPERLLAERFARGEIDEEEYRRRLEALQAAGHAGAPAGTATR